MIETIVPADLRIEPFASEHVEAAAELFASRLDELRGEIPCLAPMPAGRLDLLLGRAGARGVGAAAFLEGRLAGYLVGFGVDGVRGPGAAAYVPEWGLSIGSDPDLLAGLYTAAASLWAERGWLRHVITALAPSPAIDRQLGWLGFAPCVMDAVRPIDEARPMPAPMPESVHVRRASVEDADDLAELARLLDDHLSSAPTFVHREPGGDSRDAARALLADPGVQVLIARSPSELVGYICLADEADGVAEIVRRPGVVHVVAAFTRPAWRSHGVAEALLATALGDARERGYRAAAVDFETANVLARRFWTRFFTPVCVSYERQLDGRLGIGRRDARRCETPGWERVR